jgi:DNA processing protein
MFSGDLAAVVFGLASALSWGACDFSGGLASKRALVFGVLAISHVVGLLLLIGLALSWGELLPPDVFAIPGPIFSPKSIGPNQLIRTGAGLVAQAQDILEALNLSAAAIQQEVQAAFPDDPTEAALFDLVGYTPQHVDELRRQCDLPIPVVSSTLARLKLKGLIRQTGAMQYVRARETRAEYRVD